MKSSLVPANSPILRQKAQPVERFGPELEEIVAGMVDTMLEHYGVGLAAPQIGLSLRLFICSLTGKREHVQVFVNPTITGAIGLEERKEACLSLPGIEVRLSRPRQIWVTNHDIEGKPLPSERLWNDLARIVCHENDHLDGILITDRAIEQASRR